MTNEKRIETYLRELGRALRPLAEPDRADILNEIRAHLEHRTEENRLDEAIRALGSPPQCARGFLDELKIQDAFADGGPAKSAGALFSLATRRVTAAAGFLVSGVFYLFAIAFAIITIVKVVAPDSVGLWVDPSRDIFVLGIVDIGENPPKEILGPWMIPVAATLSGFSFFIAQWFASIFIRLMARRKSSFAV